VLIALGKLGGQELTVGSDLDLLFLIEESTDAARTRADAVARRFLGIVAGGNPPIYRLDLRLRPEGKSAPVVSSIAYFRDYFHGRAQLWERQSLLRRRILAGSVQQQRSTERLLAAIAFDVPLPEGWVEELWRMRERIEKDRGKQKKEIVDLKTTAGGLLDIEFIVQALQLCHGARNSALQTPSVIHALRALTASRAIPKPQAKALTANYEWLRTLELFIKMNSTKPEFTWPVSDETAVMLASAMDEHSPGALARHLRTVLKQNRAILHATFKSLRK
jgi:glutamate-ammonia-ligase adenylyltransferase